MVGAFGSKIRHQQADLLIFCSMRDTKSNSQGAIGATRMSSVGLNIFKCAYVHRHTHITRAHTRRDDKTDATLFLVSLISNPLTPYKMSHFLQEIHKQLFPLHMTKAAKAVCVAHADKCGCPLYK